MNKLSKYFEAEQAKKHNQFMGADGARGGFVDSHMNVQGAILNASGGSYAPKSSPYIVRVTNTTTADITDVTLFNAQETVANHAVTGTTIVMASAGGTTYAGLVNNTFAKPFNIAQTLLKSSNATQVTTALTLTRKDPSGSTNTAILVFVVDPYQYQTGSTVNDVQYMIDSQTSVIIQTLYGSAVLDIYFYPSEILAVSDSLRGEAVKQGFANPEVVARKY